MSESTCVPRSKKKLTTGLVFAAALLATLSAPGSAHARPSELPFELAVVLRGCDAPFGADELVRAIDAAIAREPIATPARGAPRIRLWFHAPGCGATDGRVRVELEIGMGAVPLPLVELAPTGETPAARSQHLAREAHAALVRIWPGVLAAAEGNPYAIPMPIAFSENPYRLAQPRAAVRSAAREWVLPNPYRR